METKQVIVVRKDLNMRRGKEISQGAHASVSFLAAEFLAMEEGNLVRTNSQVIHIWLESGMKKICVSVNSEQDLLEIHNAALEAQLFSHLIRDSGQTEFRGIETLTACAIGPNKAEEIDQVTGHLDLY